MNLTFQRNLGMWQDQNDIIPVKVYDTTTKTLLGMYPTRSKAAREHRVDYKTVMRSIGKKGKTDAGLAFRNASKKEYEDYINHGIKPVQVKQ